LLWFDISGLVILVGAEMNAEIEHASPHGKDPGENVEGQKRVLGSRVMHRWLSRRKANGEKPPSAEEIKAVTESHKSPPPGRPKSPSRTELRFPLPLPAPP
jgi:membrane protein